MPLIIFDPGASGISLSTRQYGENGGLSSNLTLVVSNFILGMDIATEHKVYEFDDFRIDVAHLMLYHRGAEIPLVPKAVETLLALIERRGKIVSKDELLEAVWPDTVVEESSLFVYLSVLRKTLGTLQDGRQYVETLRRRGYRFNGEVNLVAKERKDGPSSNGAESVAAELSATADRPLDNAEAAVNTLTSHGNELKRSRAGYALPVFLGVILLTGVLAGSFYWRSRRVVPTSIDRPKTIAILPFRPLVIDNRDEALELGMADMLITRLGTTLIVRPLSSVQRFQNSNQDPISAGRALEVEAVLEGSIQRIGDDVRVNARLLRVGDGAMIWSETFDEKYRNILVLQSTMATRIASALRPHLTIAERTQVEKRYTSNPEAYDYYYRGRANSLKITKDGLLKAIDFYDEAIKVDPNYALAYAHKADAYRALFHAGFARDTEVLPQALLSTQKALAIDESLPEALVQDAWLDGFYKKDRTSAETKFKRAIALSPNDFEAHLGYAGLLSNTKRHEEAVDEARRARELSPMTPFLFARESQILLNAGKAEEAVLQAQKGLEIDQNFWVARLHLGLAYNRQKRYDEAIAELEKATRLAPESWAPQMALARSLIGKGDREKAYAIVREWESRRSERLFPLSLLAMIYSGLGNKDKALDLLEKAAEEGDRLSPKVLDDPLFDNLRSEPRFQNILKRLNVDK